MTTHRELSRATLPELEAFFYEHGGYSYSPDRETAEQGRRRCAREAAKHFYALTRADVDIHWLLDPEIDSSDFSDDPDPWELWECYITEADNPENLLTVLGAVDLGRDGHPDRHAYARVIEAELAADIVEELAAATA